MSICDDIILARTCGVVRCGITCQADFSISQLAKRFGLKDDPLCYRAIDETTAKKLVQQVLQKDLAYDSKIMPNELASDLTRRFFSQFGGSPAQFYTNGSYNEAKGEFRQVSWNPATEATFDTGVLVITPTCAGCLWVEDED